MLYHYLLFYFVQLLSVALVRLFLSLLSVLECWERRSWIKCIIITIITIIHTVQVCGGLCCGMYTKLSASWWSVQDWCPSVTEQSLWFPAGRDIYTTQTGRSGTRISPQSGSFNCHIQRALLCVCVCVWQTDRRGGNDREENLSWSCLGTVDNVSVTLSPDSKSLYHSPSHTDKHTAPWWTLAAACAVTLQQLRFFFFFFEPLSKYRSSIRVSGHFHAANKALSGVTASIFHLCLWDGATDVSGRANDDAFGSSRHVQLVSKTEVVTRNAWVLEAGDALAPPKLDVTSKASRVTRTRRNQLSCSKNQSCSRQPLWPKPRA